MVQGHRRIRITGCTTFPGDIHAGGEGDSPLAIIDEQRCDRRSGSVEIRGWQESKQMPHWNQRRGGLSGDIP